MQAPGAGQGQVVYQHMREKVTKKSSIGWLALVRPCVRGALTLYLSPYFSSNACCSASADALWPPPVFDIMISTVFCFLLLAVALLKPGRGHSRRWKALEGPQNCRGITSGRFRCMQRVRARYSLPEAAVAGPCIYPGMPSTNRAAQTFELQFKAGAPIEQHKRLAQHNVNFTMWGLQGKSEVMSHTCEHTQFHCLAVQYTHQAPSTYTNASSCDATKHNVQRGCACSAAA